MSRPVAPVRQRQPARRGRAYAPAVPRIPDYVAFCRVAEEHAGQWEVTYDFEAPAPYRARHRITEDHVAASDLTMFAHLLRVIEPPAYVRPYIDCVPDDNNDKETRDA